MASIPVVTENFQTAVNDILRQYGDLVFEANEKGLDAAQKVLIQELKKESPRRVPSKTNFYKNWKAKKKYKGARYVGNTTMVKDKSGKEIPLSNILEYSVVRGKPFIKKTYNVSIPKMADAYVRVVKENV